MPAILIQLLFRLTCDFLQQQFHKGIPPQILRLLFSIGIQEFEHELWKKDLWLYIDYMMLEVVAINVNRIIFEKCSIGNYEKRRRLVSGDFIILWNTSRDHLPTQWIARRVWETVVCGVHGRSWLMRLGGQCSCQGLEATESIAESIYNRRCLSNLLWADWIFA